VAELYRAAPRARRSFRLDSGGTLRPVSDDEKFRIASAPGDVKPARELYKELLELMRKIAAEGRADERAAKRMEHLAVVRYTAPGPAPGRVTVSVRTDLHDPENDALSPNDRRTLDPWS